MKNRLRPTLASPLAIVAAIAALGLTAVRPILAPALPCADDVALHLLRLTQLDHLLRQGVLYSRWAPDMAQGYGYPFFNFYAPLSYYAALAVSGLGFGLNLGLRLSFALAIIASGLAAYRLARDHFSRAAALLAAVAYMYAPYQGYDIFFRGNWAESAAWPLLPLSLWTIGRLARGGGWGWLAAAGLSYAAVLLTHNIFALIFSPLLAAYALLMLWTADPQRPLPRRRFAEVGGAILLGLGLSAFFWLPAMVERSLVYSDRLLAPPTFVYWHNFISLAELLAAPRAIHPDLLNPSPPRALGLLPVLLGLPALAGLFSRQRPAQRLQIAFFGGALLVYAFLMTAVSQPIWDALPLIEYVQFPWRLLGPAALCLAILAAATVDLLPVDQIKSLAAGGGMTLLILGSLFWFAPRYCPSLEQPTVADIQEYERLTDTIGTTAKGEYVPRTVPFFPPRPAGATFATDALPADALILWQETRGLRSAAEIETAAPVTVTLNIFAYPGWRVTVDGRPVAITPTPDHGLIAFPLPAGRRQIAVRFGETPLRAAANFVSLISLLAAAGLAAVSWRRRQSQPRRQRPPRPLAAANGSPTLSHSLAPILLGLGLFLLVGGLPRWETPLYRSGLQDGSLREAAVQPQRVDFAGGMRLLGFRPWPAQAAADDPLRVDLYWTVNEPPAGAYGATVLLIGPDGGLWSPGNTAPPRDFRPFPSAIFWRPGQYALDSHLVEPLPGAPPGVYELRLRLFDSDTLQAVPALAQQALEISLGSVVLTRPSRPVEIDPQYAADAVWPPLALLGYNLDRAEAMPGDPFALTLFWRVRETAGDDLFARLTLLGPDDQPALQLDLPPIRADFPGSQWRPGEIWRGQHTSRLPASLENGRHRWRLQLCAATSEGDCLPLGETADLGSLQVNAPDRLWTPPPLTTTLDAPLEEIATLLGANWRPDDFRPGEPFPVSLIWRAEAETAVSYAVFLHLLDADGRLIAQHDGEPAGWSRPTTGWLPDEIIVDERSLSLPADLTPGRYTLLAGLYDRADGRRLALPDGDTAVTIGLIEHR